MTTDDLLPATETASGRALIATLRAVEAGEVAARHQVVKLPLRGETAKVIVAGRKMTAEAIREVLAGGNAVGGEAESAAVRPGEPRPATTRRWGTAQNICNAPPNYPIQPFGFAHELLGSDGHPKKGRRGRTAKIAKAAARAAGKRLPGPAPGAGARPIDLAVVERAATIGCTAGEIAAVVGLSRSSLYARLGTDPELTAAIDRGRSLGKVTLRRLQWRSAMDGNVSMLIWLGKQWLGQKDRPETEHGVTKSLEQVLRELDEIDREKGSTGAADPAPGSVAAPAVAQRVAPRAVAIKRVQGELKRPGALVRAPVETVG
jgi:hypothetical protein